MNPLLLVRRFLLLHPEAVRYALTGIMNTAVTLATFNLLIFLTGIARGPWIPVFSLIAYVVQLVHAFLWNKFWVFKNREREAPLQFFLFTLVATGTAFLTAGIIHFLVNIIGAPPGIPAVLWVNGAIAVTIPVAFFCNFFGTKWLVFKRGRRE